MLLLMTAQATAAAPLVRPFISHGQMSVMIDACRGEEREFFLRKFIDLAQQIEVMPKTYEQDGKGNRATAYLHYFLNDSDWYITEKDMDGGIKQAYGYAVLSGDDQCAECGYISIAELIRYGAELDLHFAPCSLAEIKAKHAGKDVEEETYNPKPWVVVTKPGQDGEAIWADFPTNKEAVAALVQSGEKASVMRRLDDGTLTTEY